MVNKQVEKRIAELQLEILLTNRKLREDMLAALGEWLGQLVEEDAEQKSVYLMKLDQEKRMSRRLRKIDEDHRNNTKNDEIDRKNVISRTMLDASSDTGNISNDDSAHCEGKCEESLLISSDIAETSQLMSESARHEEGGGSELQEEEALLMEKEWKEWMDKQEMKIHQKQEKPGDPQSSGKQSGAEVPIPGTQIGSNKKTRKEWKIKTYFSDLFNPLTSYKWQRFENED